MAAPKDNAAIRPCVEADFDAVYSVINEAAAAYDGLIPAERNVTPYMPRHEFSDELRAGVAFWAYAPDDELQAVMGIQRVRDVVLIRHAYTRPRYQGLGIGSRLLRFLLSKTDEPVLVGTWAGVERAHRFYMRHGFHLVAEASIAPLLKKYWDVPDAQINASIVLANVPIEGLAP